MAKLVDLIGEHVSSLMESTTAELERMQPGPPGTRERSKRELNNIWKAIQSLPPDIQLSVIQSMAERSGHEDGEATLCETCDFLASRVNMKE